ncbi:MAG: vitamin B12 dependent-methionine synthase activation domain-containing protein, partial [Myxococcaceae bacterium]
ATSTLPLEERLQRYVIEGSRDGLLKDLDLALQSKKPLAIINGPLMAGMDEVGRLFGKNELIVAEVLQSAEVMKASVSYLEPHMDKNSTSVRGKVVLATVKGDVHDIGKNLVEIIFANNGFQVVNLGIKVPPEQLVAAVREHRPDILGLSGLLVKSAHQMVATAEDLSRAGVNVPVLVGGAALSRNFVDRSIAPAYAGTVAYAQDAMSGLELAKQIVDPAGLDRLNEELRVRREKLAAETANRPAPAPSAPATRSHEVRVLDSVPAPPDWERHVLATTPLEQIWRFINPVMLYGRHFGVKGSAARLLDTPAEPKLADSEDGRKALALKSTLDALKAELKSGAMQARAVFRFFRAGSDGNRIVLFDGETGGEVTSFELPRQARSGGVCLADFVRPLDAGRPTDNVALFVVTAGKGIRELSERFKASGDFVKMHGVQALALETAEGYAELLHSRIRSMWGTPDRPDLTMIERFRAEYPGKRYSFGYPACPRLEDQHQLFAALRPEDIGVTLTDGCMMEPEASVSAIVFHHPDAFYFSVT